jgi:hypothetical protein
LARWRTWSEDSGCPYTYLRVLTALDAPPIPDGDVSASQYVEYARADLVDESERGLINSFGHAKRALHRIIDSLLHAYGLWVRNATLPFPQKLKILREVGVLSSAIVRDLNLERNAMEHDYVVPERQRASDAVDIANLLSLAAAQLRFGVPYECFVGLAQEGIHAALILDPLVGVLRCYPIVNTRGLTEKMHGVECFTGLVRGSGENVITRADLADEPCTKIQLTGKFTDQWSAFLSPLVLEQRDGYMGSETLRIESDTAMIRTNVTFRVPRATAGELIRLATERGRPAGGPYSTGCFALLDWQGGP